MYHVASRNDFLIHNAKVQEALGYSDHNQFTLQAFLLAAMFSLHEKFDSCVFHTPIIHGPYYLSQVICQTPCYRHILSANSHSIKYVTSNLLNINS